MKRFNCPSFQSLKNKKLKCTMAILVYICTSAEAKVHFAQQMYKLMLVFFWIDWAKFGTYVILQCLMLMSLHSSFINCTLCYSNAHNIFLAIWTFLSPTHLTCLNVYMRKVTILLSSILWTSSTRWHTK